MALLGDYGRYGGPQPGETLPDDEELSGPEGNPYDYQTTGKLPHDVDERPSLYPTLQGISGSPDNPSVPGYYFNPPPDPVNPFHDGEGSQTGPGGYSPEEAGMASDLADGLDAAYADHMSVGQPTTDEGAVSYEPPSYQQSVSVDEGLDDQLIPPDERR